MPPLPPELVGTLLKGQWIESPRRSGPLSPQHLRLRPPQPAVPDLRGLRPARRQRQLRRSATARPPPRSRSCCSTANSRCWRPGIWRGECWRKNRRTERTEEPKNRSECGQQTRLLYRIAFSREPSGAESGQLAAFLKAQRDRLAAEGRPAASARAARIARGCGPLFGGSPRRCVPGPAQRQRVFVRGLVHSRSRQAFGLRIVAGRPKSGDFGTLAKKRSHADQEPADHPRLSPQRRTHAREFPAGGGGGSPAWSRPDATPDDLSLPRSLHAGPHERRALLCPARRGGRSDGRAHSQPGRPVAASGVPGRGHRLRPGRLAGVCPLGRQRRSQTRSRAWSAFLRARRAGHARPHGLHGPPEHRAAPRGRDARSGGGVRRGGLAGGANRADQGLSPNASCRRCPATSTGCPARASTSSRSTTTWPGATPSGWAGSTASWASTVGLVVPDMRDAAEKRAAYAADITYGTNNEFGFDYLRDNMAIALARAWSSGATSTRSSTRSTRSSSTRPARR